MFPGLTLPLVVPTKLVRLVLLAVSVVRVVVGAMVKLAFSARLLGEVTDAVSRVEVAETEEVVAAGEGEALDEVLDPVAGLV
jgi:hypothetical protein